MTQSVTRKLTLQEFFALHEVVTYRGDRPLTDALLPGLELTAQQVFQHAGLER